jgi:putative glutamine amidotransferase
MPDSSRLRVAVTMTVVETADRRRHDTLSHEWGPCLQAWGVDPVLVTNARRDPLPELARAQPDALLLTGGNTPIVAKVGRAALDGSPERDRTEKLLIAYAIEKQLPVVGVARGAMMLNVHFGGALEIAAQSHWHAESIHMVQLAPWLGRSRAQVNSHHRLGIGLGGLAAPLEGFAWAGDGTVEAFHHDDLPLVGVLWHPEREGPPCEPLDSLFARVLRGERPWLAGRGSTNWSPA